MIDTSKQRIIRVIGHKNPDTDSICSAIAYAYLKNQISDQPYEARRAGEISRETDFALRHFGFEQPRLSVDMSPTIGNIDIRMEPAIGPQTSIRVAWQKMMENGVDTLCVTNDQRDLLGVIAVKDIADANMNLFDTDILAKSKTSYKNLLETLNATMLVGDPDGQITTGHILVGTSPEAMEELVKPGDIVMVTNRYEAQMCAIDCGASCIVVCNHSDVPPLLLGRAKQYNCNVIQTAYDTYAAARLITMAVPVEHYMISDLVTFNVRTPVEEVRKVMANLRHRYFPVLDKEGLYLGMISRRNLLNLHRKKVILVDHNEKSQAVDGLNDAEILEVIDHHRIGTLETSGPVYFRNEPVGCTSTIVYTMFQENGVEIPKNIAGLMLSAILSDTLMFHSPTCTMFDRDAAQNLARIAEENIEEYGTRMFEAGEDLSGRSAEDLLYTDFKEFAIGESSISVGQGFFMSRKAYEDAENLIRGFLPEALRRSNVNAVFYMLTSIQDQSTLLLFEGKGSEELVAEAFHVEVKDHSAMLPGIVSRKKQLIPPIREELLSK